MAKPIYPLEQLYLIKKKRLDEAERFLKECKENLEKEKQKLTKVEAERDTVKDHKKDKLNQLRETLDKGTTSNKIEEMKNYLKEVDTQLLAKEKKVKDQKSQVVQAEKQVEDARKDMLKKQQDIEKIDIHRNEWEKEIRYLQKQEEAKETDEIGSALHNRRKNK